MSNSRNPPSWTGWGFRPWGRIDELMPSLKRGEWVVIGALGPEQRATAVPLHIGKYVKVAHIELVKVVDPPSVFSQLAEGEFSARSAELVLQKTQYSRFDLALLDNPDKLLRRVESLIAEDSNVVLDVSCLPKRFFFILVKRISSIVRRGTFVVTYARPAGYPDDERQEPIAQDCAASATLPGFAGLQSGRGPEAVIVSVGHSVLNLPTVLSEVSNSSPHVALLFPFPPGPPSYQRNWEFVENVFEAYKKQSVTLHRLDGIDVSAAFDFLMEYTGAGKKYVWLLPYGSKPMSIAMSLFSTVHDAPVWYTQPKRYRPDYSIGLNMETAAHGKSVPSVYGYPVRINGRPIFEGLM